MKQQTGKAGREADVLLELTLPEAKAVEGWLSFAIRGENSIASVRAARRVIKKIGRQLELDR